MKELSVYFSFLRSSLTILIISAIVGLAGGYLGFLQQKPIYTTSQIYELVSENMSGDEKIAIAEQVVGLLREDSNFNSDVQNLDISRIAPFAVKVVVSSESPQFNSEKLAFVSRFISERGNFQNVGGPVFSPGYPSLFFYLSIGLVSGLTVGLCIALMKTYLKRF